MFLNYPGCPAWLLQVCTNVVVPGGDLFSVLGTWSSCVWWECDQDVATSAGLTVPMSATSYRPCDEAVTPVPACFCQQAPVFTSSPPLCWVLVWRSQLDQGDDQSRLWRSRVRHHPFTYALFLFSDLLSSNYSSLLSASSHLCFSSVHIVGSLTSKLPSINFKRDGVRICLGKMWEGDVLKAFLLRHRFDIVSIPLDDWIKTEHGSSGVARRSEGLVNVAWVVVLHRNRRIGASERKQLIPHVHFQVSFLGPESQLKSGFACADLLCREGRALRKGLLLWNTFGYSSHAQKSRKMHIQNLKMHIQKCICFSCPTTECIL